MSFIASFVPFRYNRLRIYKCYLKM